MPLSEYERRILEQMEKQLEAEDPKFANNLQGVQKSSALRISLAVLGVIIGLTLLVFGVSISQPIVGVLGFLVMFSAVTFVFLAPKRREKEQDPDSKNSPSKSHDEKRHFTSKFEERWEKRHEGNQDK